MSCLTQESDFFLREPAVAAEQLPVLQITYVSHRLPLEVIRPARNRFRQYYTVGPLHCRVNRTICSLAICFRIAVQTTVSSFYVWIQYFQLLAMKEKSYLKNLPKLKLWCLRGQVPSCGNCRTNSISAYVYN